MHEILQNKGAQLRMGGILNGISAVHYAKAVPSQYFPFAMPFLLSQEKTTIRGMD